MGSPALGTGMFETLKRAVRRQSGGGPFRECRRCGTTVERADGGCPACESTDIAQYDV